MATGPIKKRILIADDSATMRAHLSAMLANEYECHTAEDGQQTLDKAAQLSPHAILLDIEMPVMDGIAVLRTLKGNPKTRKFPVIVVTRHAGGPPMELCRSLGCAGFVLKPVQADHLKKKLELVLSGN